jgi:hypothetical protein
MTILIAFHSLPAGRHVVNTLAKYVMHAALSHDRLYVHLSAQSHVLNADLRRCP